LSRKRWGVSIRSNYAYKSADHGAFHPPGRQHPSSREKNLREDGHKNASMTKESHKSGAKKEVKRLQKNTLTLCERKDSPHRRPKSKEHIQKTGVADRCWKEDIASKAGTPPPGGARKFHLSLRSGIRAQKTRRVGRSVQCKTNLKSTSAARKSGGRSSVSGRHGTHKQEIMLPRGEGRRDGKEKNGPKKVNCLSLCRVLSKKSATQKSLKGAGAKENRNGRRLLKSCRTQNTKHTGSGARRWKPDRSTKAQHKNSPGHRIATAKNKLALTLRARVRENSATLKRKSGGSTDQVVQKVRA